MLKRFCFGAALAALLAGQSALASGINSALYPPSPITYDFSGVLNQPVNGSTSFSGTLTFNNSTIGNVWGSTIYGFGPATFGSTPLTLSVGGQAFSFVNPTSPVPGADPGTWQTPSPNPNMLYVFNAPNPQLFPGTASSIWANSAFAKVQFALLNQGSQQFALATVQPALSRSGMAASLGINLINTAGNIWPTSNFNPTGLPILKLPDFNINQVALLITPPKGSQETVTGYLTSLQPETITPEPGTIAIFAMLGACSLLYRHIRR